MLQGNLCESFRDNYNKKGGGSLALTPHFSDEDKKILHLASSPVHSGNKNCVLHCCRVKLCFEL